MDQTNKEFWDAAAAGDFATVCAVFPKGQPLTFPTATAGQL